MNICDSQHSPSYKIEYKPNSKNEQSLEWFVCENCFGKDAYFGSANEIESIVSLKKSYEIRLEIEYLSLMTSTVTSKLRKKLHEYSVFSS